MAVGGVLVRQLGTNAGVTQADPSVADKVLTDNGVGALPSFKNNFKFTTVAVSGQSDIVADSAADTLTVAAGANITLTTVAGTDTLTIAAAGSGNVSTSATLTAGKTIIGAGTTVVDVSTLTATVVNSTAGTLGTATPGTDYTALAFKTIAVSGQSDVVADSAADTLTIAGAGGVTVTTDAATDTVTISAAGLGSGTVTNTGTLTDHGVIVGNGGADVSALALATDTNQVLHGGVSADPTWEMPATPIVLQVDSTIAVDTCWVTSESLEIAAGKILTIDGGARLEITGNATPLFSGARVSSAANNTVPDQATPFPITFDTEAFDTENYHSLITNPSRFTISVSGYYSLSAAISYAANATGTRRCIILKNSVAYLALQDQLNVGGGASVSVSTATIAYLVAGDYVECCARQTSTGNLTANGNAFSTPGLPYFTIHRIGT